MASRQFRSLLDPFVIMFSVPLGMIGVIWALFLTNTAAPACTSFMGIIMMVGIVVSNGVLAGRVHQRAPAPRLSSLRGGAVDAGRAGPACAPS